MTLCKKFLLLLPLLNRIDSILSFCRTIIFYGAPGAGAAADLQDGRRVAVYLCGRDAEPCHEHLLFCEISKYVAGIKSK